VLAEIRCSGSERRRTEQARSVNGPDRKSKIENRKSKIENRKSKIENRKSKIENRKSKIENRKSVRIEGRSRIDRAQLASGVPEDLLRP
jgi:hypothetical protein